MSRNSEQTSNRESEQPDTSPVGIREADVSMTRGALPMLQVFTLDAFLALRARQWLECEHANPAFWLQIRLTVQRDTRAACQPYCTAPSGSPAPSPIVQTDTRHFLGVTEISPFHQQPCPGQAEGEVVGGIAW